MNEGSRTRFINVDLDLASAQELTELVQAFKPGASPLNCWQVADTYFANLELSTDPINPTDAESAIRRFVALIDTLPPGARALWNDASKRDFSIGVDAGSSPSTFELALNPEVLELAARVRARIVFVVYVHPAEHG
jgi:hypothetical protein